MKEHLDLIDELIYRFLENNVEIMPKRLCKLIAYGYTDARIRKLYWERLNVHMGKGTYCNPGMLADASEKTKIVIGNNVSIAPHVTLIVESAPNNGQEIANIPYVKEKLIKSAPIIIDDDVWIGANVTILPGVHIGKCAIIGAGSVVTKDIDEYCIYAGVPAKKIRSLRNEGEMYDLQGKI